MRVLQAVLPGYKFYLRHVPTRRGRGLFTRVVNWGVAAGLRRPTVRTRGGLLMEFEPSVLGQSLLLDGVWEAHQTDLLLAHLRPGDVVFNVGANTGYYALLAARAVGAGGRVFAFDIQKEMCQYLARNCRLNGFDNVTLVNKGCWSRAGRAGIADSEAERLDAGEVYVNPADENGPRPVDLVTVDDVAREHDVDRLDMLLVDTEGADLEVLRGAAEMIERHRPSIMLEVHHLHRYGSSERDVRDFLGGFGYEFMPFDSRYSRDLFCTHPDTRRASAEEDRRLAAAAPAGT